jgi:hypothetical protein
MKRYVIMFTLLVCASTLVFANDATPRVSTMQLPIFCGKTDDIVENLKNKYDEEIIFVAPSETSTGEGLFHSLWINYDTLTWTFIVVNKTRGTTCVITSGDKFSTNVLANKGTQT